MQKMGQGRRFTSLWPCSTSARSQVDCDFCAVESELRVCATLFAAPWSGVGVRVPPCLECPPEPDDVGADCGPADLRVGSCQGEQSSAEWHALCVSTRLRRSTRAWETITMHKSPQACRRCFWRCVPCDQRQICFSPSKNPS
jgi:hypothetical protein